MAMTEGERNSPDANAVDVKLLVQQVTELAEQLDLDVATVAQALPRLAALAAAQGRRAGRAREDVVASLLADLDLLDPLPAASVAQARRTAARRNRLLASGAWSVAAIAEARDMRLASARTWIKRHRDAHRLVSVTVQGEAYVPGLLLDDIAEPLTGIEQVLAPLVEAGMDSWAVWVWLDTPSGWLDGARPADLLTKGEFESVARAARSQASNATPRDVAADAA